MQTQTNRSFDQDTLDQFKHKARMRLAKLDGMIHAANASKKMQKRDEQMDERRYVDAFRSELEVLKERVTSAAYMSKADFIKFRNEVEQEMWDFSKKLNKHLN